MAATPKTFYYFGFGSNMLAKRIHIQNPTAKRITAGLLQNYRLDFNTGSKNWLGAPATVVPTDGEQVYGAIWEIDYCNLKDLDNQEGVHEGIYVPIQVPVMGAADRVIYDCRTYHLIKQPVEPLKQLPAASVPLDRQPSQTYLKVMVKGAMETGVPPDYVRWLRTVRHNGTLVDKFEQQLDLEGFSL